MTIQTLPLRKAAVGNGIELGYVRDGSGPTLIFIHGAMGDLRAWTPQWDMFVRHFDCISYSRRYNHPNQNPMVGRNHSALVDAADLEGLMDALGVAEAALVGSSYGGFTALAMALRCPDRVRKVVSVEAPMMRVAEAAEENASVVRAFRETIAAPARAAFERGDDEQGVRILTGGIIGKSPTEIPVEVMERRMRNVDAARSLALSDDEFPLLDPQALAELPMPIFLLSGAETAAIHKAVFGAVCRAIPQAKTMIVEGSGHSVSQQEPEAFNAEVLAFLNEGADSGSAGMA